MKILLKTIQLQIKNSWIRPMFRFCLIVNPIMNAFFLYHMFLQSGQPNFLSYVVLNAGLMALWGCICFSSIGDIERERYMGTLPLIYATPTSFGLVILGKIIGNTFLSMSSILISYLTVKLICFERIHIGSPIYLFLSFLLLIISFSSVALCIAYLLMLSRKTSLYMNLLELPIILFCGFAFPIEELPVWAQTISKCIPITWVVKLLRMSIDGVSNTEAFNRSFGICMLTTGICMVFIWVIYKVIDMQIRVNATLEVS
ncbi:ABC transporter permease [Anaerosporobacter faecicola]|uniref:ABC transporter permease n=1 Tax=Anaerosporobacter faecicola TaxID=2718714 RepID=UPI00143C9E69|nr:ABC transporter permease [Anaerosporobacter faecicola]